MVITGPNTGGKTVTLKTIGLLTLMAECGLHIPADDGSAIAVFRARFWRTSATSSPSSSRCPPSPPHMTNIVRHRRRTVTATRSVLFDELGAGTDPAEGAALANALIEFCRKCGSARGRHDALCRAEALRHAHGGRHERLVRVRRGDAAARPTACSSASPASPTPLPFPGGWACRSRSSTRQRALSTRTTANFEDVLNQLEQQRQQMEAGKARGRAPAPGNGADEGKVRGLLRRDQARARKGRARRPAPRRRASSTMPAAPRTRSQTS